MISDKFNGDSSVVSEICEIEYELTKRELVGRNPYNDFKGCPNE
jgi:hypothetical protein